MKKNEYQHHISEQFNRELSTVRNHLMDMGGLVEEQVRDAMEALLNGDGSLADLVMEREERVNRFDITIEEECSRILVLRQPAASDLRMIISISRAVSDLERIGDESQRIARMVHKILRDGKPGQGYLEAENLSRQVRDMLHEALDSFARFDPARAAEVAAEDEKVDQAYRSAIRSLVTFMMEDPRSISSSLNTIWTLRSLERIGDHARNLCEHVIYLVQGQDVRHLSAEEMKKRVRGEES